MKKFEEIRTSAISKSFVFAERREKTRFSFPVPIIKDGKCIESLFLTDMALSKRENNTCARPYAWIQIDAETGSLVFYADCATVDFVDAKTFPLDQQISNLINSVSVEEFSKSMDRLYASYEKLRLQFFEGKEPTSTLEEAKTDYRDQFLKIVRRGQYPFYYALNPQFFRWLGMADQLGQPAVNSNEAENGDREAPDQILTEISELKTLFKEKILSDEHKNAMFDNMHKELVNYRNEASSKPLVSMALDTIALMDSIPKIKARIKTKPEEEQLPAAIKQLDGIEEELNDILYRAGFESYSCDGDSVDIKKQKIIGYTSTDAEEKVNLISERLGVGFEYNGRIIRPERVKVYKKQ